MRWLLHDGGTLAYVSNGAFSFSISIHADPSRFSPASPCPNHMLADARKKIEAKLPGEFSYMRRQKILLRWTIDNWCYKMSAGYKLEIQAQGFFALWNLYPYGWYRMLVSACPTGASAYWAIPSSSIKYAYLSVLSGTDSRAFSNCSYTNYE